MDGSLLLPRPWPPALSFFRPRLGRDVHIMVAAEKVVAYWNNVVQRAGRHEENHDKCERENDCAVVQLHQRINFVHDVAPELTDQAASAATYLHTYRLTQLCISAMTSVFICPFDRSAQFGITPTPCLLTPIVFE